MKVAQSLNIENCKIFLKKFERDTKWMEEYTIFIDQKAQYYRDGSVPKFDLQTSVQPKQNPCCSVWECVSLVSIDKLILKYIWKKIKSIWKCKVLSITKTILRKSRAIGLTLPCIKIYNVMESIELLQKICK